jgi:hypothetical protein
MSVTATSTISIVYSGDVTGTETLTAASNAASPGQVQIVTLASGANTITVPTGGATVTAVYIVPPSGNVQTLILKGVTGDTGVGLHLTDPSRVALASSVTTFVLTAGNTITGLRLYWS